LEAGAGEAGLCGDAGAKSNVASSPPTCAGAPQDEQNRPSRGSSVPQLVQEDMNFPAPVYNYKADPAYGRGVAEALNVPLIDQQLHIQTNGEAKS
jgi:hypothetical protein